jgi:hypothetical protein
LFVVGMAKLADDDPKAILLGPTHRCGPWTKIPLSIIARVVPLATCACVDHEHPVVAVYFNDPKDPLATAFGQLLRTMQQELTRQMLTTSSGTPGTALAHIAGGSSAGGGGDTKSGGGCVVLWTLICWEKDWTGPVPPAARPGEYACAMVPIFVCWPA